MIIHILIEKGLVQLKSVIECSVLNSKWEIQLQEIADSEVEILTAMNGTISAIILRAKNTFEFWKQIESLRSTYKNLGIVLISQESDFNLAYQAIRYRVSHFLLEPIEKDNFIRILSELEEKQHLLDNEKDKEQLILSYELEQHQKLMAKIMTQMMEKPEELAIMMGEVNERYHTKLQNTYFCVIQVVILDLLTSSRKEFILNKVETLCQEKITFGSEILLSTQYQFELRIVVNMESELSNSEFVTQMKPFLQAMQNLMREDENKEWAVGIGPIVVDVREVQKSADWAVFALHNWNINCTEHLFTALDSEEQLEDKSILDEVNRKKFQKYLRQLQLVELERLMEDGMEKSIMAGNPYNTQRMILEILQLTEEIWSNRVGKKVLKDLLSKELFSYIFNSQKKIKTLLRFFEELTEQVNDQRQSKTNPQVNRALEYIHDHYNQTITMEKVALEVDLSPNYFSNLFREETGVNYLDYLTEYRLSQSKRLLKETGWPIEQISKKIGYQDVKHYSHLFKKYYGVTPGKYRKTEG